MTNFDTAYVRLISGFLGGRYFHLLDGYLRDHQAIIIRGLDESTKTLLYIEYSAFKSSYHFPSNPSLSLFN